MDEFFELYTFSNRMLCPQSAFQSYTNYQPFEGFACNPNANKRMIEFLKKSCVGPPLEAAGGEKDRSLKHMIMERMRRQKHRQIYLALHELLPPGTKVNETRISPSISHSDTSTWRVLDVEIWNRGSSDKNSILEMATKEIEELRKCNEELRRRNGEMEMILSAWENEKAVETAEIKLKVAYPASGVDSLLEVLKCFKNTGCTASAIQSSFSQHEFAAAVEFETKMSAAADIERAVQRTLSEAERRFRQL